MKPPRDKLPFREKCEVFLLTKEDKRVVAQDRGHYIMFPGGGVDAREDLERTVRRETLEETGMRAGKLTYLVTVDFVWHKEWADNPKRKARYAQYQGERVHIFVGSALSAGKPTGNEGDHWTGKKTMSLSRCIRLNKRYAEKDDSNTRAYRVAQMAALNALRLLM